MDIIINKYKYIISGTNNREDLDKILDILQINNNEKNLIINYFNSLNINKTLSYNEFNNLVNYLQKLRYKEEFIEYLYKYTYKITCPIQKNTILRLIKN